MLGKLIKHEFRFYIKKYALLVLLIIAVALVMRILMAVSGTTYSSVYGIDYGMTETDEDFISVILTFLNAILSFGQSIFSIYVLFGSISRFNTNLFTDEGYLMNTLPVKSWEHIISKLICAFSSLVVVSLASILTSFIVYDDFEISSVMSSVSLIYLFAPGENETLVMVLSIVNYAAIYFAFMMLCYMSEAIKNSINGKKILVYILEISLIVVHFMLYAFVLAFTYAAAEDNSDNAYVVSQIISIGYYVVVALVMFLITNNLMKKHLNLE